MSSNDFLFQFFLFTDDEEMNIKERNKIKEKTFQLKFYYVSLASKQSNNYTHHKCHKISPQKCAQSVNLCECEIKINVLYSKNYMHEKRQPCR